MTDLGTDERKVALEAISLPDAAVAKAPEAAKELVNCAVPDGCMRSRDG
jgi:hypothetical protein